jgi:hypothetical protein
MWGIDKDGDYFKIMEDPNMDYENYIGRVLTLEDAKCIGSLLYNCWLHQKRKDPDGET